MQTNLPPPTPVSFFVKVEGQAHSNHRSPQGIYKIEVHPEKTVTHSACAALNVARDMIPFLNECSDTVTLRAFSQDGHEIRIPRPLPTHHDHRGLFLGRSKTHPESISVQ